MCLHHSDNESKNDMTNTTTATRTYQVRNSDGKVIRIELPHIGGRVTGAYYGVPFTGTLDNARWHTFGNALCVTVTYDEPMTYLGSVRGGGYFEFNGEMTQRSFVAPEAKA